MYHKLSLRTWYLLAGMVSDREVSNDTIKGHAGVVKKLLHKVSCPILLTRQSPPPEFELKVGDALE